MRSERNRAPCPSCGKEKLLISFKESLIKGYGKIVDVIGSCECGYRFLDSISLVEKPRVHELIIDEKGKLEYRVVKSKHCKVKVPELSVEILPGVASATYIGNVEGILLKLKEVIEMSGKKKRLVKRLEKALKGKQKLTLIFEDPFGWSAIVGEGVEAHD